MAFGSEKRGRGPSVTATSGKIPELIMVAAKGFTFGCDPELFVSNPVGKIVPALMIPGTKAEPHAVKCGAVQRDGMAAEFNIEPVTNFEDWNRNIETVIGELKTFLPEGYKLVAKSAATFDPGDFEESPDDAKALGCSPDYNAWTGEVNPPPGDPDNPYLRTAAGHIHFGWGEGLDTADLQHLTNCRDLVKQLDWYLGAWSIPYDTDPTRRRLYGKAGAMRPKTYGVEYRVLGNFWVMDRDKRLMVWNRMQTAIADIQRIFYPEYVNPLYNAKIVQAINETQRHPALEMEYAYPIKHIERPSRSKVSSSSYINKLYANAAAEMGIPGAEQEF